MELLAADPYNFNKSKYFDKKSFIKRDVRTLEWLFGKSKPEIFEASKSYIGREIFLYRLIISAKFFQNAINTQLKSESSNLTTLVTIFAIEGFISERNVDTNGGRLRTFLIDCLSKDEKIELLSSYTFGMPAGLGDGHLRKKHLVHRAVILDPRFKANNQTYCSSSNHTICSCREWLMLADLNKIDKYMKHLSYYLSQMRNAVCHEGSYIAFTSMPFIAEGIGLVTPTIVDTISKADSSSNDQYTAYDTDLSTERFVQIIRNGSWELFKKGSKVRAYKGVALFTRL